MRYAPRPALGRLWIPAYAGMTGKGALRADWIPACAGMTEMGGGALRGQGEARGAIPAYAGMTGRPG